MPIHKPNFDPPFNIVRMSHVEYHSTDLSRSKAFWIDALGYVLTDENKDALYLRCLEERNHHSLVLRKASDPAVTALGFKVFSEEDLEKAAQFCKSRGLAHRFVEKPHQGRTLSMADPLGMPIELYFKMEQSDCLLRKFALYRGACVQRIDHVNCFTPDVQQSYDFYNEIGFRTTEYTETEETKQICAIWLHRKGNVHDLAFTNGRGPRLHHIGVWVASVTDIIHTCDLLSTSGWLSSMERGPGRHGISNAFFLYLRDPDGHRVELFTSDYLTVDPDFEPLRWELRDPQRQTLWGAPAPRSWFEEGTAFAGRPVRESALKAQPIVAPW
jgi:catechol 2,3-dioxygenase